MHVSVSNPSWRGWNAHVFVKAALITLTIGLLVGTFSAFAPVRGIVTVQIEGITLMPGEGGPTTGTVTFSPNPATTQVTITPSDGTHIETLKIMSATTGVMVFETTVNPPAAYRVGLDPGTYIFEVKNNLSETMSERIVIQAAP